MLFREGDFLRVEKEEGWEPEAPVQAVVVRRIEDRKGNPAYVLKSGDSTFFALTSRTGKTESPCGMGFHILKSETEIPDPEWAVGFATATQIKP